RFASFYRILGLPPPPLLFPYTTLFRSPPVTSNEFVPHQADRRAHGGSRPSEPAQSTRPHRPDRARHRFDHRDGYLRPHRRCRVEIGRAHVCTPVTDQTRMASYP